MFSLDLRSVSAKLDGISDGISGKFGFSFLKQNTRCFVDPFWFLCTDLEFANFKLIDKLVVPQLTK